MSYYSKLAVALIGILTALVFWGSGCANESDIIAQLREDKKVLQVRVTELEKANKQLSTAMAELKPKTHPKCDGKVLYTVKIHGNGSDGRDCVNTWRGDACE